MRGPLVPVVVEWPGPGGTVTHPAAATSSSPAPAPRQGFPPLLAGLIDDAALFPPGNAPVGEAVPEHARHTRAWYAPLVGPFLLPVSRFSEVAAAAVVAQQAGDLDGPLLVTAVCRSAAEVGAAVEAARCAGSVCLVGIEAAAGPGEHVDDVVAALRRVVAAGVRALVEVPWQDVGWPEALDTLQQTPYSAKLRTGGTKAGAFPDEQTVADYLVACAERNLPLKCTAGLHSAMRHPDPSTGFEHHGFLNVLLAAAAAANGAPVPAVRAVLGERDEHVLVAQAQVLDTTATSRARRLFTSYGSCSITEPLGDLVRLGLLDR